MSDYKVGQVIRLTQRDKPDFKLVGLVESVIHPAAILVKGLGWIDPGSFEVEVVTEPEPKVFENVDRDPVTGDVYLIIMGGDHARTSVSIWSPLYDSNRSVFANDSNRRVLVYDSVKKQGVLGLVKLP